MQCLKNLLTLLTIFSVPIRYFSCCLLLIWIEFVAQVVHWLVTETGLNSVQQPKLSFIFIHSNRLLKMITPRKTNSPNSLNIQILINLHYILDIMTLMLRMTMTFELLYQSLVFVLLIDKYRGHEFQFWYMKMIWTLLLIRVVYLPFINWRLAAINCRLLGRTCWK